MRPLNLEEYMMNQLKNKVAVVTGVSRLDGIGAAICKELAEAGYDIFFTYWTAYDKEMPWGVDKNEQIQLKEELLQSGVRVSSMELDLSRNDAPKELINKVTEQLGYPYILINNAAYSTNNDFSTLTAEELDKHYMVNIRATTLLSSQFARGFDKKSGGRIVNITSGQFQGPMAGELAYATTKGAIDALTSTLSAEVAHLGITVNAINPGPTDTGWMTEEIKQGLKPMFPFGRIGEPKDTARLIKFLVSEEAEWITGQVIHSEGGFKR
ncbi:3-ketoacyl-ACP reductase [Bacillus thuringiensis]|uniref:3-ketoacyl-ACP reductase n=2 Tax=Bacillaceae TaxID=186817 RepID=A0A9X6ZQY9_BACTU|nr:3-ketoacyl-ACP reductase [Bacillus thuringiensis serovar sumiyoshiensis]OTW91696.1 3-ketoacyl-ACP reductase [Bacillus thuringiensis serovar fukuokaensis]PEB09657.1 3-ketoacyl-ACP reductase [Bacillus thuringiensis]PEB86767.1 3-ketoacyl-ACP reductase [Bacillus thuringiensis]PEC16659.1 3-ketoacyl-ACP reductase [Bacillus thuringiensis]